MRSCRGLVLACLFLAPVSCGKNSPPDDPGPDPQTSPGAVMVKGTTAARCTLTSAAGRELGAGAPPNLKYDVVAAGGDELARLACGEDLALFPLGAAEIALSPRTTQVAKLLAG